MAGGYYEELEKWRAERRRKYPTDKIWEGYDIAPLLEEEINGLKERRKARELLYDWKSKYLKRRAPDEQAPEGEVDKFIKEVLATEGIRRIFPGDATVFKDYHDTLYKIVTQEAKRLEELEARQSDMSLIKHNLGGNNESVEELEKKKRKH